MKVVEVRIHGLGTEPKTQQHVVILRELDGPRVLPIFVGPFEAQAIARMLKQEGFPRPLTHDLLAIIVEGLGKDPDTGIKGVQCSPEFEMVHYDCRDPKLGGTP